jgi:nucleotide-binding universal stress UspA family protein
MEQRTARKDEPVANSGQWPSGRYVIGLDGSEHSLEALRYAIGLASLTGARLEAVIAWAYPISYGPEWTPTNWAPEDDARKVLHEAVQTVVGEEIPASIEQSRDAGSVSTECAEHAKCPVLVVHGARAVVPDALDRAALGL